MNVYCRDEELEKLIFTGESKKYRRISRDKLLMAGLAKVYKTLCNAQNVSELHLFSYLKYERLKYQHSGFSSVRIANGRIERLIFTENIDGITIELIEIDDTHYGNKK